MLLLQAAFAELPVELEENAVLEGFSLLQRLRWILLPLMGPSVVSTGLLVFLFSTLGSAAGTYLAGFRIFDRLAG